MIKACIFDMDGVIVDSAKYHFLAWQRLAADLSITFTEEDNEKLKGLSRVDSLERILEKGDLQLDNDTKLALMDQKNQWYLESIKEMKPEEVLPGVREFLVSLQENGIGIALGSSSKNAQLILEKCNLTTFFKSVIDGNKVTFSKPDPEVFLKGASELNVSPKDTVVFEDAIAGVAAANSGGFFSVGIGDAASLTEARIVIPGFENFTLSALQSIVEDQQNN
ncbi:MAG: beta-phosphoglucomutase [Flavobacteriales bacterium]|nr:beta-phosphoglucomutase [Flavobacteriales bacterium]MDG1781912.1 beta-phosphoglucomutase [Flavobacteriales bacterium]MDG2247168.1 beta-phosphoglucomutase [Flavobacteriales bacterium]